jgi:hypothetical protein
MMKSCKGSTIIWMIAALFLCGLLSSCTMANPSRGSPSEERVATENTADSGTAPESPEPDNTAQPGTSAESEPSRTTESESPRTTELEPPLTSVSGIAEYDVEETTYSDNGVRVKYPKISGLKDTAMQMEINSLIRQRALAPYEEAVGALLADQTFDADATYQIRLKSMNLLSISYSSYNNFTPSAHPYSMFHTTNIDMATGKELTLADLVPVIDEAFADALKKGAYMGEFDKETELLIRRQAFGMDMGDGELLRILSGDIGPLGICAYVTESSLGISLPVPHVAGDHVEFEISADELEKIGIHGWIQ